MHSGRIAGLGALLAACSGDNAARTDIALDFELEIGGAPFACGAEHPELGAPPVDFTFTDARLYVHGLELVDATGRARRVELDDGPFQGRGVALLDFEDGCGADGTPETHTTITGSVVPGDYVALRFTLGLPPERNFLDLADAPAPLDVTGMFWTWQSGYKFLKLDGHSPAAEGGIRPFFLHVGAGACVSDGPQRPPNAPCGAPNRAVYELSPFSLGSTRVVADVSAVLAGTDLSFNTQGTGPGCMSETNDPECPPLFRRLGIDAPEDQLLFSAR